MQMEYKPCVMTKRRGTGEDQDLGLPAPWPWMMLPLYSGDIPGALSGLCPVKEKADGGQAE